VLKERRKKDNLTLSYEKRGKRKRGLPPISLSSIKRGGHHGKSGRKEGGKKKGERLKFHLLRRKEERMYLLFLYHRKGKKRGALRSPTKKVRRGKKENVPHLHGRKEGKKERKSFNFKEERDYAPLPIRETERMFSPLLQKEEGNQL